MHYSTLSDTLNNLSYWSLVYHSRIASLIHLTNQLSIINYIIIHHHSNLFYNKIKFPWWNLFTVISIPLEEILQFLSCKAVVVVIGIVVVVGIIITNRLIRWDFTGTTAPLNQTRTVSQNSKLPAHDHEFPKRHHLSIMAYGLKILHCSRWIH